MSKQTLDEQARLQQLAEQAERQRLPASGDPSVDAYRLVIRALRQPLRMDLPADFAKRVAARAAVPEESSRLEDWLMSLLLLVLAGGGLFYVAPVMAGVASQLHIHMPSVPWRLLAPAAASIALAWALDRGAINWRQRTHLH